jgi:predicted XRE-type DNA-binding protein
MRNERLTQRVDPIPPLKRQLGQALAELLKGGNADDIASFIGTDQPRVSELSRGKLTRFSLETLIRYLERLDHGVDITVTHVRPNVRHDT